MLPIKQWPSSGVRFDMSHISRMSSASVMLYLATHA